MLRVCVVNPPSPFLLDERVFMPLGVLKVASALRSVHGVTDTTVLDCSGYGGSGAYLRLFREMLDRDRPSHVCLSANSPQLPAALAMARIARRRARVILGGPHATLSMAAAKREAVRGQKGRATETLSRLLDETDVVVAGDGEVAVRYALETETGSLLDADDPTSAWFLREAALADWPVPDRSLIDVASYDFRIDGIRSLSLIAQLGCPFGCGFCGGRLSATYRRVRQRPAAHVIAELVGLYRRYGATGFMFVDDEVNIPTSMPALMDGLARAARDLGVTWTLRGHVKAELFTDEQARLMVAAGFRSIFVGFESGHERILQNMNKRATKEENTRCVEIARRHGLRVKALMSLGHPGESLDSVRAMIDWLLAVRPHDLGVSVITTYPGTPYYDEATQIGDRTWSYRAKSGDALYQSDVRFDREMAYYKGAPGRYRSFVWTDDLSADQLVTLRDQVEMTVRTRLGLAWPTARVARYEQSMGQTA